MGLLGSVFGGGGLFGGGFLGGLAGLGFSFMTGGLGGIGMQVARMVISQVAQNVAKSLNLPPFLENMLLQALETRLGPGLPGNPQTNEGIADLVSKAFGMPLGEAQSVVESFEGLMQELMSNFADDELKKSAETGGAGGSASGGAEGASGGGKRSWIMVMAEKLGDIVDEQFMAMDAQMNKVAGLQAAEKGGDDDAKTDLPGETIKMQAEVQEFNMLMNMANNAIKTAGQASGTMAGRQ